MARPENFIDFFRPQRFFGYRIAEDDSVEMQNRPTNPPHVPLQTLSMVIRDRDLRHGRRAWVDWLRNSAVPVELKCRELHSLDLKGWSPLHYAARYYREDVLDAAKEVDGVNFNIRTTHKNLTPFLVAAKYSKKDAVLWMLQNDDVGEDDDKMDLKAANVEGRNALHLTALDKQSVYSVEPLVRQLGELCSSEDKDGNTPLHLAAMVGNLKAIEDGLLNEDLLSPDEADGEEGEGGGEGGDVSSEEEEVQQSVRRSRIFSDNLLKGMVGKRNNRGRTALHLAAENGCVEVVSLLIEICREAITMRDQSGDLPLHLACRKGHVEVAKKLLNLESGTLEKKYRNKDGDTAIHCAARSPAQQCRGMMTLLMNMCREGTKLDLRDALALRNKFSHTPLMVACLRGSTGAVEVLLENGADITLCACDPSDVNGNDSEQLNCLELAIENGRREIAKLIIEWKANNIWRKALRNRTKTDTGENTPFRRLIRKMPDIAYMVLENCTKEDGDHGDPGFSLTFDYEFVEDFRDSSSGEAEDEGEDEADTGGIEAAVEAQTSNQQVSSESATPVLASQQGAGQQQTKQQEASEQQTGPQQQAGPQQAGATQQQAGATQTQQQQAGQQQNGQQQGGQGQAGQQQQARQQFGRRNNWGPKEYKRKNHILAIMAEQGRSELLGHPLVTSLLDKKWNKFGAWYYFSNLFVYVTFVAFLTAFALTVRNPQSDSCRDEDSDCNLSSARRAFIYASSVITLLLSVVRLIQELLQLIHLHFRRSHRARRRFCRFTCRPRLHLSYWLDFTNYLELVLYFFSIAFVLVFFRSGDCLCPTNLQWEIGTVAVFFSWINLLLFLHKLPRVGVYVGMMVQIIKSFMKTFVMALFLIIAFSLAFYMAFYDPDVPASPYANIGLAFVKLIDMTAGGPDDSIFGYGTSSGDERGDIPFPGVSYFLWVIFIVIMAVLFINFLTGLAVDDVKQIKQKSAFNRLALKVELVLTMEEQWSMLQHRVKDDYKYEPNKIVKWYHPVSLLWRMYSIAWGDDLADSIQATLSPEEDTDFKIAELNATVSDLVELNKQQQMAILDIVKRLEKIRPSREDD